MYVETPLGPRDDKETAASVGGNLEAVLWKETMESETMREREGEGQRKRQTAELQMMSGLRIKSLKKKTVQHQTKKQTGRDWYTRLMGRRKKERKKDLNALDGDGTLAVELVGIAAVALLLAVLEALALVVLEHAVLTAVMARAEAAVADNGLGAVLAVLEGTADLLWRHAATQGQGEVQSRVWADGVVGQGCFWGGEMLAGVDYAQIRRRVHVCAEGEERAEGAYRGI